jgi:hypothetical protein
MYYGDASMFKAPRLQWYTFGGLAEYWRHEYRAKVFESTVKNYVDSGELKASTRYEHISGAAWWADERPDLIGRFDVMNFRPLDNPPIKKTYIRLADAELFEQQHFTERERIPEAVREEFQQDQGKAAGAETQMAPDKLSIIEYVNLNRGKIDDAELCYNLFKIKGYSNNAIAVALGEVYRPGSNAASQKIVRLRKKHEIKLGNLTP